MTKVATTEKPLWYWYDQNNSGGYCIRNDVVGDDVFIQANSPEEANARMYDLIEDYSEYCECCGERWYVSVDKGYEEPSKYGESILTGYSTYYADGWGILYGINGRVARVDSKGITEITKPRIE